MSWAGSTRSGAVVVHIFDPVVMAYGPAFTIVLVVVFLLAVGYWVFIRG